MLGLKQKENNDNFLFTERNIKSIISKQDLDNRIDKTLQEMKSNLPTNWGVAWSGGKDSVVLEFLANNIKSHPTCIGMTNDLEYPEFMKFVTDNMPNDLNVYTSGHTLKWLSENLGWLFPKTGKEASRWFKAVQHKAQDSFVADYSLDMLLTGRRKKDMNYTGVNGLYRNKKTGVLRYSPIYDWSHEEVIACMVYYNLPRAPFYSWNNGWVVGSGSWAARQWTGSIEKGWQEIAEIDKSIVIKAAKFIQSAEDYVRNMGL